jgi:hypothetical protein
MLPRFGDVGVALVAVILSVVGLSGALAAETGAQTNSAASSVPPAVDGSKKQAVPTLSAVHPVPNAGAKSVAAPAMSVAKQPINMGIDPFKSECQTPATAPDTVLQPLPNTLTPTIGTSSATKFVPLFKLGDRADDPLNKGNFVEKHEFGIELKTNF